MKKIKAEEVTTINELAIIMRDSFQSSQDYMDKNFKAISEDFRHVHYKLDEVDKKLDNYLELRNARIKLQVSGLCA